MQDIRKLTEIMSIEDCLVNTYFLIQKKNFRDANIALNEYYNNRDKIKGYSILCSMDVRAKYYKKQITESYRVDYPPIEPGQLILQDDQPLPQPEFSIQDS